MIFDTEIYTAYDEERVRAQKNILVASTSDKDSFKQFVA